MNNVTNLNISTMTIAEVQAYVRDVEPTMELIDSLRVDRRQGVQRLADQVERRLTAVLQRASHFEAMLEYERTYWSQGIEMVVGVDEAGRGPLAGPVVAAAVVIEPDFCLPGLNDSKQLTEEERERFYEEIIAKVVAYGVGIVDHQEIDQINILQASFKAMRLALEELIHKGYQPEMVLVDGDKTIPGLPVAQSAIVDGDAKSISIAAASVIAKVTRDRMMVEMSQQYPGYGFERNKGYSAPEHLAALRKLGPSPIHRLTFAPVRQSTYSSAYHGFADRILATLDLSALHELGFSIGRQKDRLTEEELADLLQLYAKFEKKCKAMVKTNEDSTTQGIRML